MERKAGTKFTALNDAMRECHEVFDIFDMSRAFTTASKTSTE